MPCDLLENSRSSPTSNHPFNELFPRHRHQLQNHSTPVSCSAKHIQDVLPRRRSRDPAGRWPPCLPRHPLPDVLALPLCRGSLYQHPLRPQEEDLSHPVLGLLHHRLQRALPDCRVPNVQAQGISRESTWLGGGRRPVCDHTVRNGQERCREGFVWIDSTIDIFSNQVFLSPETFRHPGSCLVR